MLMRLRHFPRPRALCRNSSPSPTSANSKSKSASGFFAAFIIADHYGITGLFTFYLPAARAALPAQPLVYCVDSDEPKNQFFFWPEYRYQGSRRGQNAIFITDIGLPPLQPGWFGKWVKSQPVAYADAPPPLPLPPRMRKEFESVTDLGEFEIKIGNRVFRRLHLWACRDLK